MSSPKAPPSPNANPITSPPRRQVMTFPQQNPQPIQNTGLSDHDTPIAAHPHAVPIEQVIALLSTDPHRGLESQHAAELILVHGHNELAERPPVPWWKTFAGQFNDLVI